MTEQPPPQGSLWADALRRLAKNRLAVLGCAWLVVVSALAAAAPWIVPFDPQAQELWIGKRPPLSHRVVYHPPIPNSVADWRLTLAGVSRQNRGFWNAVSAIATVGGLIVAWHGHTNSRGWTDAHRLFVGLAVVASVGPQLEALA